MGWKKGIRQQTEEGTIAVAGEASKEGTIAVAGEASKEGTPSTVPGQPATPIPVLAGTGKPESVSKMPHILMGEEYQHFQLLNKQEANEKCKQPVGTCEGPEKTATRGPGWPQGSRSKGQGRGAGQGGDTETSIQKYLS